jgi:hypothetical protein
MLEKKIGKLRQAAVQFRTDAPKASAHTNFQQAVISMDACVESWESLLAQSRDLLRNRPAMADEQDAVREDDDSTD